MFQREKKLREAFSKVHSEFEEHLDAINSNAEELLENRAMIYELQERMCKLADQVANLKLIVDTAEPDARYPEDISLSLREQEAFLTMYMSHDMVSYADIAKAMSLPVSLAQETIDALIFKGIPIIKQRNERGILFLSIDMEFKEEQSKRNILRIDNNVLKQLSRDIQMRLFE